MKKIAPQSYALIPVIILCCFYLYQATGFVLHDFANYYFGGYFLSEGRFTSDMYFPDIFNRKIASLGHSAVFASFAPNTPFLTILFYPFAFLNPFTAKLLFNLISVLLFVYSLKRISTFYAIQPVYIALIPVLFFVPIKNNLLFGQLYFLLFFLLSEGWLAYEKKQFPKMGVLWSIAILLKIFPAILILFLLSRKNYKPVFYLIASSFLLTLFSIVINGTGIWIFFFREVLPKASNGEIATAFVDNYQSFHMLLKRLFIFNAMENPNPIMNNPAFFHALLLGFKLSLLCIGFYISKNNRNKLFSFSYWIITAIVISPYGSTYTFILLLFPFIWITRETSGFYTKSFLLGIVFAICNLPVSLFIHFGFPVSYLRLLLVFLFFLCFTLSVKNNIEWKWAPLVLAFSFLAGLFSFYKKQAERSESVLPNDSPILIYDYTVSNNQLTYSFWNENGENKASLIFPKIITAEILIKNNQVFYNGKQLTFGHDHKRKAHILNDHTILYLSDYDRGIGFYTLRKISIP